MAGTRPFDDGRWPDQEGYAECFLCGRVVDPLDRNRAFYDEPPAGPQLPIHARCAPALRPPAGFRQSQWISVLYRRALNQMTDVQFARLVAEQRARELGVPIA